MTLKHIIYSLFFVVSFILAIKFYPFGEIVHSPGVLIDSYPRSFEIENVNDWNYESYKIIPIKKVILEARVLGAQKYYADRESDICPIDLALGWGPMSDSKVLDQLNIYQSQRWFFWESDRIPIPIKEIQANSSNMHMIPADEKIMNDLEDLSVGSLIEIEGYLVRVEGSDGWKWESSISWTDTGGGACELVWISKIKQLK